MGDAQWEKLDGDAELVRSKGKKYQDIADAIGRATATLDKIVDDASTTAKSMDATKTLASDVRDDIAKATDRYRYTGDALVSYATPLESAVSTSDTAATKIREYETMLTAARITANNAQYRQDELKDDAPEGDVDEANSDLTQANSRVSELEGDLAHWQGEWQSAKDDKDAAARTARNEIDEVVTGDKVHGLEDSTWDKIKHVASSLYKVFKIICDIAGILSIFLAWVPGLGQVLIALAAIGAILSVLEAGIKLYKGEIGLMGFLGAAAMGVLAIYGGRIVTTLAGVAKSRGILSVARQIGPTAARGRYGDALTDAYRVGSRGRNLFTRGRFGDLLKSPFVRNAAQREALRTFQTSSSKWTAAQTSLRSAFGDAFSTPFKDMGARYALRNEEVVGLMRLDSQALNAAGVGTLSAVATVGAIGLRMQGMGTGIVGMGEAIDDGNWVEAGKQLVSPITGSMNGSYGDGSNALFSAFDFVNLADSSDGFGIPDLSMESPGDIADAVKDNLPGALSPGDFKWS